MDGSQWIIVAVAIVGSAIIKNGVGIGAGIFLLTFLSIVLPAKVALGIGAPAMLISDIVGIKSYWGEWDKRELKRLIPTGLLGVLLGGYMIKIIPGAWFQLGIGLIAFCFAAFQLLKPVIQRRIANPAEVKDPCDVRGHDVWALTFGFLGGLFSAIAHAGGMVMSMYMLQKHENKRRFVGTFVFFIAIMNLSKMFTYSKIGILTSEITIWVLILSPLIVCGGFFGNALNKRVSQAAFRTIVLAMIMVIGARVVWMA